MVRNELLEGKAGGWETDKIIWVKNDHDLTVMMGLEKTHGLNI